MNAFSWWPWRMPSQYWGASSRSRNVVVPWTTSNTPGRLTCPDTANMRMPGDASDPTALKASPPFSTIHGRLDSVSTLFTIVGCRYRPLAAGKNGGFSRGMPRLPSRLSMSPVSSPTM